MNLSILVFILGCLIPWAALAQAQSFTEGSYDVLNTKGQVTYSFKVYQKLVLSKDQASIENQIFSEDNPVKKETRHLKIKYFKDSKNKWWVQTQAKIKVPVQIQVQKEKILSISSEAKQPDNTIVKAVLKNMETKSQVYMEYFNTQGKLLYRIEGEGKYITETDFEKKVKALKITSVTEI